ncbi:MAG: hypothetical protein NPIRA05_19430 [Nitrospirales bacterium]|nr:MAG: hypothetical protein NPIRA05_19430 [Nitrospirales bacterium]
MSLYAFGTVEEEHIGAYGSFFSGISSALAFIWIIAGYLLQNFELRETRKILKNQQATLQRSARAADRETYKELLLPALNSISHSISELINLLKLENIYGNDNDELPDISLEYILEQIQDTPNFYEHLARAVDNSIPSPVGYAVSQLEFSITTLQEKIDDLEDRDIILSSHRSLSLLNTMKKRLQEISGGQ